MDNGGERKKHGDLTQVTNNPQQVCDVAHDLLNGHVRMRQKKSTIDELCKGGEENERHTSGPSMQRRRGKLSTALE